jgi:type IV secretion system protein VirD4
MPILSQIKLNDKKEIEYISPSIAKEIDDSKVQSAIIQMNSFLQTKKAEATLSSIRTVLNSCLQLFLDENVKKLFNRPNISMSELRKEESIIYIQIPERHSKYFSPLTATFLTQLFDYLAENDGLQIYCLFDEFTNCGIVPSISKLLSTLRKHNVSIVAAIQSLNQLYTLYGELLGKEISELFKTTLVCNGLRDSAEYISNLLGIKEYQEKEVTKTKPLMTADEVRRLEDDDILIICKNKRPVIDKMMDVVVG